MGINLFLLVAFRVYVLVLVRYDLRCEGRLKNRALSLLRGGKCICGEILIDVICIDRYALKEFRVTLLNILLT